MKIPRKQHRRRDKSEAEHLKGQLRESEKEIRRLQQQLKLSEKSSRIKPPKEAPVIPKEEPKIPCFECGKGFYVVTGEVLGRIYAACDCCSHNKRIK